MTGKPSLPVIQRLLDSDEHLLRRTADDEEYSALVARLSQVDPARMHHDVVLFLIFVGLFMRREVFRKGRGLWYDIWARLGHPCPAQTPTLYDHMEHTLKRHGIKLIRTDSRRFVETFWREVGITPANLGDLLNLFRWYYSKYYPDRIFEEDLFDQWSQAAEFSEQKPLMVEAVEKLVCIMEALQEPDCPLAEGEAGSAGVREFLRQRLGFDPHRVLPSDRAVYDFYLECLRLITPAKMRRLASAKAARRITMPDGRACWGHELAAWTNLPLGEYVVDGRSYQVTPHPKASLEVLSGWPAERLLYPLRGCIAYRSHLDFPVLLDGEERRPYRLYRHRKPLGYVWFSRIPVGQVLTVNGHDVRPAEGVEWQPGLRLWRPDAARGKPPRLYVDVTSVRVNFEELEGRQITIACGDQIANGRLNADGTLWLRDVSFDLSGLEESLELRLLCGNTVLSSRTITLADALLFADSTGTTVSQRRLLAPGSWFYLFSEAELNDDDVRGGEIRDRWNWGRYHVARIRRTHGHFSITGENEWQLFEEEFLHLRLDSPEGYHSEAEDDIVHDLTEWVVTGSTNVGDRPIPAVGELLSGGEVQFRIGLSIDAQSAYGNIRRFRLDRHILPPHLGPGEYLFRLTALGLTALLPFRLVPALKRIHGLDLCYREGDRISLTAEWDSGHRYDLPPVWAAVESVGPRGMVRFGPRTVQQTVRLHDAGVTAFPLAYTVECRPWVFGIRILHNDIAPDGQTVQRVLRTVTREDLLNGARLYCFGRPGAEVALMTPDGQERWLRLDDGGHVEVSARWLAGHLTGVRSCFRVRTENLETQFLVVWRPEISAAAARSGRRIVYRITGSAPPGSPVVIQLTDIYGQTRGEQVVVGLGADGQQWEGEFVQAPRDLVYLRVGFAEGGTFIPLSCEVRIERLPSPQGTGAGLGSNSIPTIYGIRSRVK